MPDYIPNPTQVAEPQDSKPAGSAAAEFRALKTYIANLAAQLAGVDLTELGYKALKHVEYVGESAVTLADNGKAHKKTDGTLVQVGSTLPVEFLCTIMNVNANYLTVMFTGGLAYMQGDDAGVGHSTWELAPFNTMNITKVGVNELGEDIWFISGQADYV